MADKLKRKFLAGCMKGKRRWREGRAYRFAHRLRGLFVGLGVGLSGPLAVLCSLALEKNIQTFRTNSERIIFVHVWWCVCACV